MTMIEAEYDTQTQLLVAALLEALPDPMDQIRLLANLASIETGPEPGAVLTAALTRRHALRAIASAVQNIEPTSSNEARRIIDRIGPLFEAEIERAADAGDRDAFREFRGLRMGALQHLQQRGSQLPELITHAFYASLSSAKLANMIYRDATRADELVRRNERVVNPYFMPKRIEALSQ